VINPKNTQLGLKLAWFGKRFGKMTLALTTAAGLLAASTSPWQPGAAAQTPAATTVATPQPGADIWQRARLEQKLDTLAEKASQGQTVRLIVGVQANFQAEGELPDKAAVLAQREHIARAQAGLLGKLNLAPAALLKQFRSVPYLVLELDAASVKLLKIQAEVTSVAEDVADEPDLTQSTAIIGAPGAWAQGFTGVGQTVAVLDTGFDLNHPFYNGRIVSQGCFSTTSAASSSTSICPGGVASSLAAGSAANVGSSAKGFDHGTHVLGIAAGNGLAFDGVARNANIIAVKVFSRFAAATCTNLAVGQTSCLRSFRSDQIDGLERVLDLSDNFNIAAVNLSLGGGQFTTDCDSENPAYTALVNNLRSVGVATVISSGNDSFTNAISFPACISAAVSVGATTDADQVAGFSNSDTTLDLLAPGVNINSSVPNDAFGSKQGTSMAAPHVTGAFAVLKSKAPNFTMPALLSILKSTGLPVTDARNGLVRRRIRLDQAINALCAPSSFTVSPSSTTVNMSGGSRVISVNAPTNGCAWGAQSNVSWITVSSATHTGDGSITLTVAPWFSFAQRTGTVFVAGRTITVRQDGLVFFPF
jgi:subtilisin